MDKEYTIANKKYKLIEYGDLTREREEEINNFFGFLPSGESIKINLNPEKIFPLILVPVNHTSLVDTSKLTYNQMIEIIVDYKEAMQSFFDNLPQRLSLSQK